MLSDAEQHRLAQIEAGLRIDDPSFVRRFDRRPARRQRHRKTARIGLAASLTALAVAAIAGALLAIPIAVVGVVASATLWASTR